jgi:DNA-binding NtrC family response regulator
MRAYSWPGNVRELKHMMTRATILCGDGPIGVEHLPADRMTQRLRTKTPPRGTPIERRPLPGSDDEERWIKQALDDANGNQTLAAKRLGISRRTLINRLNAYGQVHRPRKNKRTAK